MKALGLVACAGLLTLSGCHSAPSDLQLYAASSTRVLNSDLEKAFNVVIHNAGSSTLVYQIEEGAPADLLITADKKSMDKAVAAGVVDTPVPLATNTMVLIVPKGNPAGINSPRDITADTVWVACDPAVPCGGITQTLLNEAGITLQPNSYENQVADVVGKVASGEADCGWVYSTDAQVASKDVDAIAIPGADKHTNPLWGAVVTASARKDDAGQLLALLHHDFTAQWQAHGFGPVN